MSGGCADSSNENDWLLPLIVPDLHPLFATYRHQESKQVTTSEQQSNLGNDNQIRIIATWASGGIIIIMIAITSSFEVWYFCAG